jgi:hypothetical protein
MRAHDRFKHLRLAMAAQSPGSDLLSAALQLIYEDA